MSLLAPDIRTGSDMLAISLWQPWATLWVVTPRVKLDETRHWPFPHGYVGRRCLVHASKTREGIRDAEDTVLGDLCARLFGEAWASTLPLGGYLGSVVLGGCRRTTPADMECENDNAICGNFGPNRYAWRGDDARSWPLIPGRGQQGFWSVDPDTLGIPA